MRTPNLFVRSGLFAVAAMILLGSCASPEAEFATSAQSFKPGDTVHIQNNSKGSDEFEWYLEDKLIGNAANLSYVIGEGETGVLTFKLKASAEGKEPSVATHTILVEPTTGTVTVWSTFAGVEVLHLNAEDAVQAGTTASGFEQEPVCNAEGCVNIALAPGTHTIDGVSPVTRTRRIIDIVAGECVVVKMH